MASSPNVVRSLSADELASSLTRSSRPAPTPEPNHSPHPHSPPAPANALPVSPPHVDPEPEHKHKSGLLKRLRRAFRLNAQSVRSFRTDKAGRHSHHPHHALSDPNSPINPASPNKHQDIVPNADTAVPHSKTDAAAKPIHSKHHAPRARTWRGPLSSKNLISERHVADPVDPVRGVRRSMGLAAEFSKKTATNPATAANAADPSVDPNAKSSTASTPTRNAFRSLPKRVVSSPPSLTGRSFGFSVRKRNSTMAKAAPARSSIINSTIGEGDSDSVKKLDRVFNARGRVYDGRGSMNLAPIAQVPNGYSSTPEHGADAFRSIVEGAASGRVSFIDLLDAMFRLEERILPEVKDTLIKFLSRPDIMEILIDRLTTVVPTVTDDEGVEGPGGERERYRFSYVSCMLLSNGPIQLRRSLFLIPKHLDRLVGVLGHGEPTDPVVVRSVCKVLLSVLRDSPEDTVRAMSRRKDFLDALLSHIAVTGCPEVCLSMLSTVRCQAELKFGPSNKPVVGMMADSKLVDSLCARLADAAENGPLDGTASSTIENCSRVIVGIALRALVIPRYEIGINDDSDTAYMLKFNRDLSSLDVFSEPKPILRLLDSGLTALSRHDARGYALSTALTAVRYLLVTALNGQDSSLSTIRMQLMTVNTAAYEAGVRARIPRMAHVLEHAREGVVVETMWEKVENPLGVVRLKILELIVVLLQHCTEATAKMIVDSEIPRILLKLFVRLRLNSLLQHFVAAIVELSFTGKFSSLRRAFLLDVRLIEWATNLWNEAADTPEERRECPVNYSGELIRIMCAIHEYFKQGDAEVREMRNAVGHKVMENFESLCENAVAERLKENGTLLCGPGELPPRPMDNMIIDGYAGVPTSDGQGSMLVSRPGGGSIS